MGVLKNPRHEAFAQALVKGMSADAAYVEAGFSEHRGNAARLSSKENIRSRVDELQSKVAKKVELSVEKVLRELSLVAFADMGDYMKIREDGTAILDWSRMPEGGTKVVGQIEQEVILTGDPNDSMPVQKTKFKLHDKLKALEMLGRHLKMFVDKQEITGKDGGPIQVVADIPPRPQTYEEWIRERSTQG